MPCGESVGVTGPNIQGSLEIMDWSVSPNGRESLRVVYEAWNNSNTYASFDVVIDIRDSSGTLVGGEAIIHTQNPGSIEWESMTFDVDVPAGEVENFEVCVDIDQSTVQLG